MSQISKDAPRRSITIVDSPKVIRTISGAISFLTIAFVVGYLIIANISTTKEPFLLAIGGAVCILFILFAVMFGATFMVEKEGYVIDVENGTLTFPGGGIEAESWLSYFSSAYLFQYYKRHQIRLSEIREIESYIEDTSDEYTDSQGRKRTRTRTTNKLDMCGHFGAISFNFASKGKMDQLYSAIVQLNKMGNPIILRR